jgi:hypothetical protein
MRPCSALLLALGALLAGCETIKPYEKELLLDPLMSDERALGLSASFMSSAAARFEKLAGGAGGTAGTSCPTCGG